jgi:pre-rRNA-processing protein TSR3
MPESENEDDDEEMAEIRRKVLASKPFSNPVIAKETPGDEHTLEKHKAPNAVAVSEDPTQDSDAESGTDLEDYGDFDQIANATLVTDRTGLAAKERQRRLDSASATFSRTVLPAPQKR